MDTIFVLVKYKEYNDRMPIEQIIESIKQIKNVVECHVVQGIFDIVVKMQSESLEDLRDSIYWKLRTNDGIQSTISLKVMQ